MRLGKLVNHLTGDRNFRIKLGLNFLHRGDFFTCDVGFGGADVAIHVDAKLFCNGDHGLTQTGSDNIRKSRGGHGSIHDVWLCNNEHLVKPTSFRFSGIFRVGFKLIASYRLACRLETLTGFRSSFLDAVGECAFGGILNGTSFFRLRFLREKFFDERVLLCKAVFILLTFFRGEGLNFFCVIQPCLHSKHSF